MTVTFPLPDERGVPAETCTIATDITERKERDSERRERLEWTKRIGSALDEGRRAGLRAADRQPPDRRPRVERAARAYAHAGAADRDRDPATASCPPPSATASCSRSTSGWSGRALELAPRMPAAGEHLGGDAVRPGRPRPIGEAARGRARCGAPGGLRDHRDRRRRRSRCGAANSPRRSPAPAPGWRSTTSGRLRLVHLPALASGQLHQDRPRLRRRAWSTLPTTATSSRRSSTSPASSASGRSPRASRTRRRSSS